MIHVHVHSMRHDKLTSPAGEFIMIVYVHTAPGSHGNRPASPAADVTSAGREREPVGV